MGYKSYQQMLAEGGYTPPPAYSAAAPAQAPYTTVPHHQPSQDTQQATSPWPGNTTTTTTTKTKTRRSAAPQPSSYGHIQSMADSAAPVKTSDPDPEAFKQRYADLSRRTNGMMGKGLSGELEEGHMRNMFLRLDAGDAAARSRAEESCRRMETMLAKGQAQQGMLMNGYAGGAQELMGGFSGGSAQGYASGFEGGFMGGEVMGGSMMNRGVIGGGGMIMGGGGGMMMGGGATFEAAGGFAAAEGFQSSSLFGASSGFAHGGGFSQGGGFCQGGGFAHRGGFGGGFFGYSGVRKKQKGASLPAVIVLEPVARVCRCHEQHGVQLPRLTMVNSCICRRIACRGVQLALQLLGCLLVP